MRRGWIAILAAVVLLTGFSACGRSAVPRDTETTDAAGSQTEASAPAEAVPEDDVALPQENTDGKTTTAVIAQTTAFRPAAIMQELATAPQTPEETTTQAPTETTTQSPEEPASENAQSPEPTTATTTQPPETTTKPATAELLQSSVLRHIQSGTYTETISAFGKDQSSDDKLSKIVTGGKTAYYLTIPAAGLTFRVFPADGKYYIATATQYCELTKSQYDSLCSTFGNAFCNFSALKYQKTETVREGLRKYTREDFTIGGRELSLWYSGGALFKMEMNTDEGKQSLPITVTGTADSGMFVLPGNLEEKSYADMEALVSLASLFFG